jgi:hypothetical protein
VTLTIKSNKAQLVLEFFTEPYCLVNNGLFKSRNFNNLTSTILSKIFDKSSRMVIGPQHNPTRFFREVNSIIFDRSIAADYDSVLEFFQARQDFEIIGL